MEKAAKFDVIVIGGGPGGYPAAIRAAQRGKTVALIEKGDLGGVCLNWGCIPTKALIADAKIWKTINHGEDIGAKVGKPDFDYGKMCARKDEAIKKLRGGLEGLITSNGITLFRGKGQFLSPKEIKVIGDDNAILTGDKIIIATGSRSKEIGTFPCDEKQVVTSTGMLRVTKLPKSLVVIGGGYIGCEFAGLYKTLGLDVVIVEALPTILPMESPTLSAELTSAFMKQGIPLHTSAVVEGIDKGKNGVTVRLKDGKTFNAEMALVAVGRTCNTEEIGLEKAGIAVCAKGCIPTNEHMETVVPGIYAVGDVTGKIQLAHVATHQGLVAADNACGIVKEMHYDAVPAVVFTTPEIASVGLSPEKAAEKNIPAATVRFPFLALGRAVSTHATEGFVSITYHKGTGQLLGAQVVGKCASTLIAELGLAIANELTVACVEDTIHAHPTLPEAWMEAALLGDGMPVHLPPKTKGRKA